MNRAYYSNSISSFLVEDSDSVLGKLSRNHSNRSLEELQMNAWVKQIKILKGELKGIIGSIYFEFAIPRMGKRVDNIIIVDDCVFVVEFKVGDDSYGKHAETQVIDYCLDLRNFHEGSHHIKLIPVLIATNAAFSVIDIDETIEHLQVAKCNKSGITEVIEKFNQFPNNKINVREWENSIYKPTPTIVEAAQALYKGHKVEDISRSDSGEINLTKTSDNI